MHLLYWLKIANMELEEWEIIIWIFLLVLVFHRNHDFWFFIFHIERIYYGLHIASDHYTYIQSSLHLLLICETLEYFITNSLYSIIVQLPELSFQSYDFFLYCNLLSVYSLSLSMAICSISVVLNKFLLNFQ